MPTLVEIMGMETGSEGVVSATHDGIWNATGDSNGTCTYDSSVTIGSHSGYSFKCDVTTNGGFASRGATLPGTSNVVVQSSYCRITLPTGTAERLKFMEMRNSTAGMSIAVDETGLLFGRCSDTQTYATLTDTVATNTWFLLDARYQFNGTTWTLDVQVNRGPTRSVTEGSHANSVAACQYIPECAGDATSCLGTVWHDDMVFSMTTGDFPIGPHRVKVRRPIADGTHNTAGSFIDDAGTAVDASTNPSYVELDDNPWPTSGNTDRIRQATTGTGAYVQQTYGPTDQNETLIWGVQFRAIRNQASTNACTAGLQLTVGGSNVTCWGYPTVAWAANGIQVEKSTVIANPTKANVDAMVTQFGTSNDISPNPSVHAIEVEYAVPTTSSIFPSLTRSVLLRM